MYPHAIFQCFINNLVSQAICISNSYQLGSMPIIDSKNLFEIPQFFLSFFFSFWKEQVLRKLTSSTQIST